MGVVGGALMTGGTAAVQGIQMLNPQRWVTGAGGITGAARPNGYSKNLQENALFEADGEGEEDYVPTLNGAQAKKSGASTIFAPNGIAGPNHTHHISMVNSLPFASRAYVPDAPHHAVRSHTLHRRQYYLERHASARPITLP